MINRMIWKYKGCYYKCKLYNESVDNIFLCVIKLNYYWDIYWVLWMKICLKFLWICICYLVNKIFDFNFYNNLYIKYGCVFYKNYFNVLIYEVKMFLICDINWFWYN